MMVSLVLYSVAVLGMFLVALKYGMSAAPLDYHQSIIAQDGAVTHGTQRVVEVLYRVWASSLAALGISLLALIWGPAASGADWAHVVILLATLVVGVPSLIVPRRVEQATEVRTPWRLSLALLGAVILGFLAWAIGI